MASDKINASDCQSYTLISAVGESASIWLVYAPHERKFEALFSCLFSNLKDKEHTELKCDWLLHNYFNRVNLLIPSASFWIPSSFYNQQYINDFVALQLAPSTTAETTKVLEEELSLFNMQNLFEPPLGLAGKNFYNCALNYILEHLYYEKPVVYVHFFATHLAVFIICKGKLQFSNFFKFKSKEDVVFYLAATCQKNNLALSHKHIYYTGFLRTSSALYRLLFNYFPHLQELPIDSSIQLASVFDSVPLHFYNELFNWPVCE